MTKCDPEAQEILEYIAESPAAEHGGFDDRTIRAARWAVEKLAAARAEVERLQGELDECRRLLREAIAACEVYLPVVPDDKTRVALLTLEWYEAARAEGGGE